jgi:hypothetical protein
MILVEMISWSSFTGAAKAARAKARMFAIFLVDEVI